MLSPMRNMQLSVQYRLWTSFLALGYVTPFTARSLSKQTVDRLKYDWATQWTYGTGENHHGWVAIDDTGQSIPGTVSVYVSSALQPASAYKIDFMNGWVIFPSNPAGPVTATYREWNVGAIEDYPDDQTLETMELPIVAHSIKDEAGRPYGIGTSAEFVAYGIEIDVLGRTQPEVVNIASYLRKMMTIVPILDFSDAQPLAYGNCRDDRFNAGAQTLGSALVVRKPRVTVLNPRHGGSKKERHRALITAQIEVTG